MLIYSFVRYLALGVLANKSFASPGPHGGLRITRIEEMAYPDHTPSELLLPALALFMSLSSPTSLHQHQMTSRCYLQVSKTDPRVHNPLTTEQVTLITILGHHSLRLLANLIIRMHTLCTGLVYQTSIIRHPSSHQQSSIRIWNLSCCVVASHRPRQT